MLKFARSAGLGWGHPPETARNGGFSFPQCGLNGFPAMWDDSCRVVTARERKGKSLYVCRPSAPAGLEGSQRRWNQIYSKELRSFCSFLESVAGASAVLMAPAKSARQPRNLPENTQPDRCPRLGSKWLTRLTKPSFFMRARTISRVRSVTPYWPTRSVPDGRN